MEEVSKNRIINLLNSLPFKTEVNDNSGEIYAVGGIVRDAIMSYNSDDLDIVIRGIEFNKLIKILEKYGKAVDTSKYEDQKDGVRGAIKFVSHNYLYNKFLNKNKISNTIDIMLPKKEINIKNKKGHKGLFSDVNHMYTIYDDMKRRDININAMAISEDGKIIDINDNGKNDIKNKIIRVVNSESFLDDPIRMVRIIRQSSKFNFDIDSATVNLIKNNANLLADKAELPKERFLMEFKKMIGKTDLGKAIKTLVDLGMYEYIFGITPKNIDYNKFDKAKSIGEMAYMMFENEPMDSIAPLVLNNITNDVSVLNYIKALVEYNKAAAGYLRGIVSKEMPSSVVIGKLAKLYKLSSDAMSNSSYIEDVDRNVIDKFNSGELPKSENDIAFKGSEFKDFVVNAITDREGSFVGKRDGIKMGRAKILVLDAVYNGMVKNDANAIKQYLIDNPEKWMG